MSLICGGGGGYLPEAHLGNPDLSTIHDSTLVIDCPLQHQDLPVGGMVNFLSSILDMGTVLPRTIKTRSQFCSYDSFRVLVVGWLG